MKNNRLINIVGIFIITLLGCNKTEGLKAISPEIDFQINTFINEARQYSKVSKTTSLIFFTEENNKLLVSFYYTKPSSCDFIIGEKAYGNCVVYFYSKTNIDNYVKAENGYKCNENILETQEIGEVIDYYSDYLYFDGKLFTEL